MKTQNSNYYEKLLQSLLDVDRVGFRDTLAELLKSITPLEIVENHITPILQQIGSGWGHGQYALSQMYMAGKLCEEVIPALLEEHGSTPKNKVPLAITILQDHHVLGKKIVFCALKSSGYNLIDYGSIQTPGELAEKAMTDKVGILFISTLMLPSALLVKETTRILKEKGAAIKVVVGGAPFNFDLELWKEVGADAMRTTATEAIPLVADLLKEISQ